MNKLTTAATAALALTAAAPRPAERVADTSLSDVLVWTVSNDRTVYVEDSTGQWYRVDLAAPCAALRTAFGLALETSPGSTFDRSSSLFTGDQSCAILSMSRVSEPAIPPQEPFAPAAAPRMP
jgi:hypothetical protein